MKQKSWTHYDKRHKNSRPVITKIADGRQINIQNLGRYTLFDFDGTLIYLDTPAVEILSELIASSHLSHSEEQS